MLRICLSNNNQKGKFHVLTLPGWGSLLKSPAQDNDKADRLIFRFNIHSLGSEVCLRYAYFFGNLSLTMLINILPIKEKACSVSIFSLVCYFPLHHQNNKKEPMI